MHIGRWSSWKMLASLSVVVLMAGGCGNSSDPQRGYTPPKGNLGTPNIGIPGNDNNLQPDNPENPDMGIPENGGNFDKNQHIDPLQKAINDFHIFWYISNVKDIDEFVDDHIRQTGFPIDKKKGSKGKIDYPHTCTYGGTVTTTGTYDYTSDKPVYDIKLVFDQCSNFKKDSSESGTLYYKQDLSGKVHVKADGLVQSNDKYFPPIEINFSAAIWHQGGSTNINFNTYNWKIFDTDDNNISHYIIVKADDLNVSAETMNNQDKLFSLVGNVGIIDSDKHYSCLNDMRKVTTVEDIYYNDENFQFVSGAVKVGDILYRFNNDKITATVNGQKYTIDPYDSEIDCTAVR